LTELYDGHKYATNVVGITKSRDFVYKGFIYKDTELFDHYQAGGYFTIELYEIESTEY